MAMNDDSAKWHCDPELLISEVEVTSKRLGKGSYGEVYRGTWCGTPVAVKSLHPIFFDELSDPRQFGPFLKRFEREWLIIKSLDHQNILKFFGVFKNAETKLPSIVTELMDENLDKLIQRGAMRFIQKLDILKQTANGLNYMHTREPPVVHRDIAPKNILVKHNGKIVKIGDYGTAKIVAEAKPGTVKPGTENYMPPEALAGQPVTGFLDMFSYGIVMLEVLCGEEVNPTPILDRNWDKVKEINRRIESVQKFKQKMVEHMDIQDLALSCLRDDPSERPTAAEAFDVLSEAYTRAYEENTRKRRGGDLVFHPPSGRLRVTFDKEQNPDEVVATTMAEEGFYCTE